MKFKWIYILLLCILVSQVYSQRSDFADVNFKIADSIAESYKDASLHNLPELSFNLTSNLNSEVEKFRAIYKWVTANIANDYALYLKTKRKKSRFADEATKLENWNLELKKEVFKTLLEDNRTVCTGYAYLVKELANLSNLQCEIIHGYGRTSTVDPDELTQPNHSWNAVNLDDKWYLCDATWASGIPNPETKRFEFNYNDGFFLAEPELFSINHYPVDDQWLLFKENNDYKFETYLDAPVFYNNAYIFLNKPISPKKLENTINRNDTVLFQYSVQDKVNEDDIKLMIGSGQNSKKIKPDSILLNNDLLSLEHKFKYKGRFDVHLLIEDKLIASYTFRVTSKK